MAIGLFYRVMRDNQFLGGRLFVMENEFYVEHLRVSVIELINRESIHGQTSFTVRTDIRKEELLQQAQEKIGQHIKSIVIRTILV